MEMELELELGGDRNSDARWASQAGAEVAEEVRSAASSEEQSTFPPATGPPALVVFFFGPSTQPSVKLSRGKGQCLQLLREPLTVGLQSLLDAQNPEVRTSWSSIARTVKVSQDVAPREARVALLDLQCWSMMIPEEMIRRWGKRGRLKLPPGGSAVDGLVLLVHR
ncbi:hypothetical protein DTO271G3_190 [Paecilomyces variotii]|nr:hypothetical protein DTO271G3_190 [Paecilomyces variotii]